MKVLTTTLLLWVFKSFALYYEPTENEILELQEFRELQLEIEISTFNRIKSEISAKAHPVSLRSQYEVCLRLKWVDIEFQRKGKPLHYYLYFAGVISYFA